MPLVSQYGIKVVQKASLECLGYPASLIVERGREYLPLKAYLKENWND